jgi:hypothetical protein
MRNAGGVITITGANQTDSAEARYTGDKSAVRIRLFSGTIPVQELTVKVKDVRRIEFCGYNGNDTLFGDAGDENLWGAQGFDVVYGGDDDDNCFGDNGDDIVFGGNGSDWVDGDAGYDQVGGAMLEMTVDGWFSAGSDWDWNVDEISGEWIYDDQPSGFFEFPSGFSGDALGYHGHSLAEDQGAGVDNVNLPDFLRL